MSEKRIVVLVPRAIDMEDDLYLTKYWPNFVESVKERLSTFDCKVVVAGEWPPAKQSERV